LSRDENITFAIRRKVLMKKFIAFSLLSAFVLSMVAVSIADVPGEKNITIVEEDTVEQTVPAATAPFVGNKNSKKLHRSTCRWADKISEHNRIYFQSYEEAQKAGYVPCKQCKPDQAADASSEGAVTSSSGTSKAAAPADGYCASKNGKAFHRNDCRWASKISEKNLVRYKTREEAIAAGKTPCKVCKP
jgi:methylphosphotriester-DNA--protein-cysteine methyltransferase